MIRKLATLLGGIGLAATSAMTTVAHAHGGNSESHGHSEVVKVGLWGDQFYASDPAQRDLLAQETIDSMNAHHLDFTLYAGDSKNGSSECTDQVIGQDLLDRFDALRAPTLYSLGDNEWTDCHRTNNGSYDPLERLSYLRSVFFTKDESQGRHPIAVKRQSDNGSIYGENSRFAREGVQYVALHVVGSNNNFVVTGDQCTKKSNRTQADCDAATAEYQARNAATVAWLREAFAEARTHDYAGVVLVIQADVYAPFELSDGGYQDVFLPQLDANNGYTDFFNALVEETHDFAGQVLLVHGDSHYFRLDKPMYEADGTVTRNFTRVEVFGSTDNSWVEMTVDPNSPEVFTFKPVVLE